MYYRKNFSCKRDSKKKKKTLATCDQGQVCLKLFGVPLHGIPCTCDGASAMVKDRLLWFEADFVKRLYLWH